MVFVFAVPKFFPIVVGREIYFLIVQELLYILDVGLQITATDSVLGTRIRMLISKKTKQSQASKGSRIAKSFMKSHDQGPYSPNILRKVVSLVLQMFLHLEAYECNTTSDWLNRKV